MLMQAHILMPMMLMMLLMLMLSHMLMLMITHMLMLLMAMMLMMLIMLMMLMMLLVLISNVKPEDCKCSRRLLLVDITQERCDLEARKVCHRPNISTWVMKQASEKPMRKAMKTMRTEFGLTKASILVSPMLASLGMVRKVRK